MFARRPDEPVDPFGDRLVPELRVLRLQNPVSLIRKVEHTTRNLEALQSGEELEAFANIEAVVELSVNDQCRSLEVGSGECGRPASIERAVGPGRSFELPLVEPEFLGSAVGAFGIE